MTTAIQSNNKFPIPIIMTMIMTVIKTMTVTMTIVMTILMTTTIKCSQDYSPQCTLGVPRPLRTCNGEP
jgi:hypothetical protein